MIVSLTDYTDIGYTDAETTTLPPPKINETIIAKEKETSEELFSCDHSIQLYILNQTYFTHYLDKTGAAPTVSVDEAGQCYPAHWASYIPKTNMLLVVVEKDDNVYANCTVPRDTKPQPTPNSTDSRDPCHKLDLGRLTRSRLEGCYTYHEGVSNFLRTLKVLFNFTLVKRWYHTRSKFTPWYHTSL